MGLTLDFIHNEIDKQSYEISLHADDERIADGLTISIGSGKNRSGHLILITVYIPTMLK